MNRVSQLFVIAIVAVSTVDASIAYGAEIFHAQGEFAGEVTADSVLLQSRLTAIAGPEVDANGDIPGAAGSACFEWSTSPQFVPGIRTPWMDAKPEHDYIVRTRLSGLKPGTKYYYRLVVVQNDNVAETGPTREFQTLPEPSSTAALSFCMGSCQNYAFFMNGISRRKPAAEEDRRLGYPVYAAMKSLEPDFFIGTGDIVYYDHPEKTAAKTLPELRRKWHEQFRLPRLVEFYGRTPAYWSKDDHDFRFNDADLGGKKQPESQTGIEIFREQMPIYDAGDLTTPTYRTHRVHKHLQLWFTEGRDYRSPNRMPDGPDKSLWGREQRAWLERTLKESDATWKVIISPTPLVGPDRNSKTDNHTNLAGFKHEADAFFAYLRDAGLNNVFTFCGDRHWQYHSIHPLGVEEFGCGALNDENAIAGEKPGTPKSTDPEGLIKQPFLYPEPSGGFLHVEVSEAGGKPQLKIEFRNDENQVLYTAIKHKP